MGIITLSKAGARERRLKLWKTKPTCRLRMEASCFRESFPSRERGVDEEGLATVDGPTVWVPTAENLVRPVPVKVGLSDDTVSEITGGALEPGTLVVLGTARKAEKDFSSAFVSKVTARGARNGKDP